ncbi:MAG: cobalamin B12-binding domain-containing protein [Paracoccaceae bacterium]
MKFDSKLQDEICDQLLLAMPGKSTTILDQLTDDGMTDRDLYLNLLAATARRMGELWDNDKASFLYIQCAMQRIETILRDQMPPEPTSAKDFRRNAIFATLPNEAHTIGLNMAASIQRSKGWNIELLRRLATRPLLNAIQESEATILGISIGSSKSVRDLYSVVDMVRARRPDIRILVSGSLVATDPKPFQELRVDAITSEFSDGERILEGFAASTARITSKTFS